MTEPVLTIDGATEHPAILNRADLALMPPESLVPDVGVLEPRRAGAVAVRLSGLLDRVVPHAEATHVTLHATADGFAASIPLDAVRDSGLVLFEQDGQPLSGQQGGPFRFLILNAAACRTAELDACANVKFLDRIELTVGKGRDTR